MKQTLKANKMLNDGCTLAEIAKMCPQALSHPVPKYMQDVTANTCFAMPGQIEESIPWRIHHITPAGYLALWATTRNDFTYEIILAVVACELKYAAKTNTMTETKPDADRLSADGWFKYGEHFFKPNGKIDPVKGATLANIRLRSHTKLKMWDKEFTSAFEEQPAVLYDHNSFYVAMNDCDDDIFLCDNGKLYIPCNHELMEFLGYR